MVLTRYGVGCYIYLFCVGFPRTFGSKLVYGSTLLVYIQSAERDKLKQLQL